MNDPGPSRLGLCLLRVSLAVLSLIGMMSTSTWADSSPIAPGYWHTDGTRIVDGSGAPIRIAAVTWYGMETSHWVPAGLDFQRYSTIMDEVKLLGYTVIRLPFSNESIERNPVVTDAVAANPELRGRHALEVLDAIVTYAQQIGLEIILDNHRSRAARPLQVNTLDEPLWYTVQYPDSAWIHDWQTLAARYRNNDAVIGFDLRNEPHTDGPGPWNVHAYLHQGATWGPYHGVDNGATDWRLAAQRAGNAVLTINPHLLIIVEGITLYPRAGEPGGVASTWWGGILTPVKTFPVQFVVPHQLVYSVHEWGPRKHQMPWFSPLTYRSLQKAWRRNWSFLLDGSQAPYIAPLLLGEFGTCNDSALCITRRQPSNQATWFQFLLRFLREHPAVGWSFFALNGTNANNCRTDNGLLNARWDNVANASLQANLATAQGSPGLAPTDISVPLVPGTTTHRKPRSPHSRLCRLP